ncbi:hypothetical protein ACFL0M_07065 [Thermodesulfobacteriota bacterium]
MITDPYENIFSSVYKSDGNRFTEWMQIDNNGNGIIELDQGEWKNQIRYTSEYQIYYPVTPHAAGTYTLNVILNNGQLLSTSRTVTAGVELPQISDVTAEFDPDGQFKVSWIPALVYPENSGVDIRLNFFEKDGSSKYDRYRARYFPTTLTSHTLDKYWSDYIRTKVPIVQVSIWIWSEDRNSRVHSDHKDYKIDGYTATPITKPEPSLLSQEEVDALVAEACPGNSENPGRPDSPGKSNPPGRN